MNNFYLFPWFDAHVHLRGPNPPWCTEAFEMIVKSVAEQCKYAVIMPNSPIIKTVDEMIAYRKLILTTARKVAPESDFIPLMTLYLTDESSEKDIKRASKIPWFAGWKLYPQGVTTGSENGVSDFSKLARVLRAIDEVGSRLLIHGETMKPEIEPLYTEEVFITEDLPLIRQMFRGKICLEHCSTLAAFNTVIKDKMMWCSVTPHHLTGTFEETGNPHNKCKPVWQTEEQRRDAQYFVTDDTFDFFGKFFAGTDSAPQLESQKLSEQVPNGCFSSPTALQLYFQSFWDARSTLRQDDMNEKLFVMRLNRFLYGNAALFYNLPIVEGISTVPVNGANIVISNEPSCLSAEDFKFLDKKRGEFDRIVPLRAGEQLQFSRS